MAQQELNQVYRSDGGLLSGLYQSAFEAGQTAAVGEMAKDIGRSEDRRQAILNRGHLRRIQQVAGLTAEEKEFGVAFGLLVP